MENTKISPLKASVKSKKLNVDLEMSQISSSTKPRAKKECSICLDTIKVKTKAKLDSCGHIFCTSCIKDWGRKSENRCPICRREFFKIFYHNKDGKYVSIKIGAKFQGEGTLQEYMNSQEFMNN